MAIAAPEPPSRPGDAGAATADPTGGRALRVHFTRLLVAAVVLPALLFGALQLLGEYRHAGDHLRDQLRVSTRLTAVSVDRFLQAHVSGVALLADTAAACGELPRLDVLKARYPRFVTTLVTDETGRMLAALPASRITPASRRNVADRDYFRATAETLQPHVSDAFVGRGFGTDPLVAVSAPRIVDGRFAGIVEGSIRIDSFTSMRSTLLSRRGQELLIVDRGQRVVYASEGLPFRFMQPLRDAAFLRGEEEPDGVSRAHLHAGALREGGDAWVAWSQLPSGWRVALFAPVDSVQASVGRQALSMATVLLLAVTGALLVAGWQFRRLARATSVVLDALRSMASGERAASTRLENVPVELQPVARAIARLAGQFDDANAELRQTLERQNALADSLREAIEVREREIHQRTRELRVANVELERLTRTDAQTGVLNVRGFRSRCDALADADGALRERLGVLVFDVDHFKSYNDRYGHPAGDRVLRRVAGAAQGALRGEPDCTARIGGEEFVVLLPGADAALTHAVGERIRATVAALGIPHAGAPEQRLSISVGVVVADAGELLEIALQQADEALYRAKAQGRNRVSA